MKKTFKKKLIIYGGSGLVGSCLVQTLSSSYYIIAPSRREIDLTKQTSLKKHLRTHRPSTIIYAAGLTSIEACEEYPKQAYLLNSIIPGQISKEAAELEIPLYFFSTDAVFDGKNKEHPNRETDIPNPTSVYGKSKLLGEEYVLNASKENVIIRLIMVYSASFEKKVDFARKIVNNLIEGKSVYGISNQIINPILVDDIASALIKMLSKRTKGVYHLGAKDYLTNLEFVLSLAEKFHLNNSAVIPITLDNFFKNHLISRSKYCWLDTKKFCNEFGSEILHTNNESISIFQRGYKSKY